MRCVLQRVSSASLTINQKEYAVIKKGLVIFLGITEYDNLEDINWLVNKITKMRVFPDEEGLMNKSIQDVGGEALLVSQFTLYASTKKGNRPSFIQAAKPDKAIILYDNFRTELGKQIPTKTGVFGADMMVQINNDGPVTILIDSKKRE